MKKHDITRYRFKIFFYKPDNEWVAQCTSGAWKGTSFLSKSPNKALKMLIDCIQTLPCRDWDGPSDRT